MAEPDMNEKRFDDLASRAGEMFEDYFIAVRSKDGGYMWRATDPNWAVGMVGRYINHVNNQDFLKLDKNQTTDDGC